MLSAGAAIALIAWVALLLAPFRAFSTRERLDPPPAFAGGARPSLSDVTVLIPARNEASVLAQTLQALMAQGDDLEVIVVDDDSEDGTAQVAARFAPAVRVIAGQPLPGGWAGKLWALEQGLAHVDRPRVLLLDADIALSPGMVSALREKAERRGAVLVSVMAKLRTHNFWERLLVPPFIFFFKLLYPFALVNNPRRRMSAAAGGCMLVDTAALRDAGGYEAMRDALIDDCTLAKRLKGRGAPVWLGLSDSALSLRGYERLSDLWRMVARSAFTQLRYSSLLLLLTTVIMLVVFLAPVAALLAVQSATTVGLGAAALAAMALSYLPVVHYYRLPSWWALTLPVAGLMFLAMTISSALAYWRGTRATWKNRRYETT
jgi:hopene-associated glycosyltransferase HpnB